MCASQGLRYTGLDAVVCGRSEMVLPNGVGNLEKGERFIFGCAIKAMIVLSIRKIYVAYDVFNCNLAKGCGRADCECCVYLMKKYREAIEDCNRQVEGHRGLTRFLPPGLEQKWAKMCEIWKEGEFCKKGPNPFEQKDTDLSRAEVEKELAEYEADQQKKGAKVYHTTTASIFISLGIDLEEAQYKIKALSKHEEDKEHLTLTQLKTLAEQCNILRSKLVGWAKLHAIYMPGLLQWLTQMNEDDSLVDIEPEDF
ncbi:hypothetical protein VNI00_017141 [Paramarasmius palmivorus]|uniref:Uncharacterized protein n=1 Tax=Paramarasmius palmivorus TaxID=297713 RepID=A0AAW0B7N8_9AGAR